MAAATKNGLTEKQQEFARQFVLLGKAAAAYRAVYEVEKMDGNAVRVEAHRLLQNPNVALMVEHHRRVADKALEVSVRRIAEELARIAFFDPRDLFTEDGGILPIDQWPENAARAIAGMEVKELYTATGNNVGCLKKVKIASKTTALQMLATWKRMLIERMEIGKPGEFDNLTDAELEKQLAAEEAALAAIRKAAGPPAKAKKKTAAKT